MPEPETKQDQIDRFHSHIDELNEKLSKAVNIKAIAFFKLRQSRRDRNSSSSEISDNAIIYRNAEKDLNQIIEETIAALCVFFELTGE